MPLIGIQGMTAVNHHKKMTPHIQHLTTLWIIPMTIRLLREQTNEDGFVLTREKMV